MDNAPIPPGNWLQFDSTNQEFYGLPMASDVGSVKYQLVNFLNCQFENNFQSNTTQYQIENIFVGVQR